MQRTLVVWLGALICCSLWGSAFPCVKIGYELFNIPADSSASQILFAGYRFTLAGVLTIAIGSILNKKFLHPQATVESCGRVVALSFFQTVVQYLFFYLGLAHTSGVKASIIEGMNVFVAIFVASLIFHQEKLTVRKLLGSIVGFVGVAIVTLNGSGMDASFHLNGEGFIFLSTVSYAFSSVVFKRFSKKEHPVMLSGYQFLVGGIIMTICGAAAGGEVHGFTPSAIAMLIYLAVVSAVAYSLWGILLKYNPISRVAVFGFMNPVIGVILSAILLGEGEQAAGYKSILALILVCIGIYIVNRQKNEQQDSSTVASEVTE